MIPRREEGSALIAVLALLFTAGMLVAMTVAVTKQSSFSVGAHVALQRSMYEAEGMANRAVYLTCMDRIMNSSEVLGETDYESLDTDRYIADAIGHTVDYYGKNVEFTLTDTQGGWDFSSSGYRSALATLTRGREDETDLTEKVEILRARIVDYIDSDDDIGVDGQEEGDYELLNKAPLPRNAAIQFREELLYIPGFRELFPPDRRGVLSQIRLIPPERTVRLDGAPGIFTVSDDQLRGLCNLDEDEIAEVRAAIEEWKTSRTKLSESINPGIFGKLNAVSRRESGTYTVEIGVPKGEKRPFRRLRFSFQAFGAGGPSDRKIQYLEWFFL